MTFCQIFMMHDFSMAIFQDFQSLWKEFNVVLHNTYGYRVCAPPSDPLLGCDGRDVGRCVWVQVILEQLRLKHNMRIYYTIDSRIRCRLGRRGGKFFVFFTFAMPYEKNNSAPDGNAFCATLL